MTKPIRIGFYLRSATGNLVDLKRQLNALTKELPARGFDPESCAIEVYRDGHQSGLRIGAEFERLLEDVRSGQVQVVMVARMNRISRSLKNLMDFHKFVTEHAIRWIGVHENVDSIHWHRSLQSSPQKGLGLSTLSRRAYVH